MAPPGCPETTRLCRTHGRSPGNALWGLSRQAWQAVRAQLIPRGSCQPTPLASAPRARLTACLLVCVATCVSVCTHPCLALARHKGTDVSGWSGAHLWLQAPPPSCVLPSLSCWKGTLPVLPVLTHCPLLRRAGTACAVSARDILRPGIQLLQENSHLPVWPLLCHVLQGSAVSDGLAELVET